MQSSTCKQWIKPFGKRDEAMYKTATATSVTNARKPTLPTGRCSYKDVKRDLYGDEMADAV